MEIRGATLFVDDDEPMYPFIAVGGKYYKVSLKLSNDPENIGDGLMIHFRDEEHFENFLTQINKVWEEVKKEETKNGNNKTMA